MAKLYSLPVEARALRVLCSTNRKLSGFMLANTTEQSFHVPEAQAAFKLLRRQVDKNGEPFDWDTLLSHPRLSESARDALQSQRPRPVKTLDAAKAVADQLNVFRQTRVIYQMTKEVQERLTGEELDIEAIQDLIATAGAQARTRVSVDDCFFHMGRDNNSTDIVHEILFGENKDQWIPTSWATFDDVNGGLPRGGLVIVAGASGSGKCVGPTTRVTMASGQTFTISHLWDIASRRAQRDRSIYIQHYDDGSLSVENLNIPVRSFDPATGEFVVKRCTSVIRTRKRSLRIGLSSGKPLVSSPDHKWWCRWRDQVTGETREGWRAAKSLVGMEELRTETGWVTVYGCDKHTLFDTTMFDLTVEDTHAYIANGAVSHNSHMCTQLALAQAQMGYKAVVVCLEMSEAEMFTRVVANISKTDSLRISLKKLTTEEQNAVYRKFKSRSRKIEQAGGRLTIFRPKEDMSIEEVLHACHSYGPDLIYVDYIGLLAGADGEDQWRRLGQIARHGKVYAGNYNKVVVLAAQLSEDGKIRYSQAIKEHASLAFTFAATKESREGGYLRVSMLKGRNQQLMDFTLKVDYATSTMRDLDPDERGEGDYKPGTKSGKSSNAQPGDKAPPVASMDDYAPPDLS